MYDKLVKRLREKAGPFDYEGRPDIACDYEQAADAIWKLSKPRWIPVSERLPEESGKNLVCGRWRGKPTEMWVCEFMTLGHMKGWANNAANPVVSHWMPLPEPPEEG